MTFDPSWYEVLNALSGVLFIMLGILVGRVQAGGTSNRAFALFAIAFGTAMVILNLLLGGAPKNPDGLVEAVSMFAASLFSLVSGIALVWLWRALPRESSGPRGRSISNAPLLVILYAAAAVVGTTILGRSLSPWLWMFILAFQFQMTAMWGLCAVCAFRFRAASVTRGSGYAIMAAALAIYPAFWGGIQYASGPARNGDLLNLLSAAGWLVVPVILIASLWLYVGASVPRLSGRTAFAVAWISLGAALAGLLAAPPDDVSLHTHYGYGVSRILSVGLLGFAILRGQAPGIDGTLRFGVSRSMVAAAFVAVFFIASEGAQMVVGRDTPLLGLLAAGALVFVMAPLQKVADRFAEQAVPVDPTQVARASHVAADAYRHALRAAMRNGKLARREERHLAELARTLDLDSVQALALREEVENELA